MIRNIAAAALLQRSLFAVLFVRHCSSEAQDLHTRCYRLARQVSGRRKSTSRGPAGRQRIDSRASRSAAFLPNSL